MQVSGEAEGYTWGKGGGVTGKGMGVKGPGEGGDVQAQTSGFDQGKTRT